MAKDKKEGSKGGNGKMKGSLDINSLIGWLIIIGVVIFGIVTTMATPTDEATGEATGPKQFMLEKDPADMLSRFWDPPSVIIVLGGAAAALMLSFPLKSFAQMPKHLKICFLPNKYTPTKTIQQTVELAKEARINGLLALEDKLAGTSDDFLRSSLMLVVDSVEPEKVTMLLETELGYLDDRHAQARAFYQTGAALGPAFGMIGTLIGLIKLLADLGGGMEKLGAGMAVALVTTFYGSLLANVFFTPISTKLKARHDEEYLCKMLIAEGVQAIQAGDNPRFIEEKLTQLIPRVEAAKGMPISEDDGSDDKPRKK